MAGTSSSDSIARFIAYGRSRSMLRQEIEDAILYEKDKGKSGSSTDFLKILG